ncbi:MAG: hypothetical protein MPJ50_15370, partial [Pirellulales bacterium]|nr:hypothetical protein [Pirellulales bacterium]
HDPKAIGLLSESLEAMNRTQEALEQLIQSPPYDPSEVRRPAKKKAARKRTRKTSAKKANKKAGKRKKK